MPVEQVYVLEMIIRRIELEEGVRISDINSLSIGFKFLQLMNFDIDTAYFSSPEIEENSKGRNIKMNYGKTFLFIAKPSLLRLGFQNDPYQITLYDGNVTVGSATVPWKTEFAEMVKFFEKLGIVKSTTIEDVYKLYDPKNIFTAKVKVFLRLSCFGKNLQTMFQVKSVEDKQEYIFRQRNSSKTFIVQKHADERCQPIVAPLYCGIADAKDRPSSIMNIREATSLTQIFGKGLMVQKSDYRRPSDGGDDMVCVDFQEDYEEVSICFRPSHNKFFDLLNFISADVKTTPQETEVRLEKRKVPRVDSFLKSVGGNITDTGLVIDEDEEDIKQMTADKIAKRLCGNKNCPAAKKFKEYGIGPLATGKGLGTVYGDIEPPVTYGISHTYGTLCEYGPYGVFSRPKHEELPFIPRTEGDDQPPPPVPCKIKRKKKKTADWHSKGCPLCPERLRGGADEPSEAEEGTLMPKSPILECKSVMDQFDNILAEYKKAIGPCGHATCPYAQTLAEDTCKKMCNEILPPVEEVSSMSCNDIPCDVEGCPYAQPKKKRYPAGCGSPKCAYTKYKLGLLDDDAEMELRFLPPALGANCGDPRCKYPLAPPLPPIHWECPDPLPKGPCRNLNCPFQPKPLKKFITKKQLKTGPCGSPMCPYALPQPCGVPTCPFAMVPCPMVQEQQKRKPRAREYTASSDENICENPECPFAEINAKKRIENELDDPKFQGEFQDCENVDCPYKQPKEKKKAKKKKQITCGNPECSTMQDEKKSKKKKKTKRKDDGDSICSNPDCPDRVRTNPCQSQVPVSSSSESRSVCSNLECPFAKLKKAANAQSDSDISCDKQEGESLCSNPECPERLARQQQDPNACNVPSSPQKTICDYPDCPYAESKKSKKAKHGKSLCSNPDCPYAELKKTKKATESTSVCSNPDCPYADQKAESGSVISCDKQEGESICSNPECPERLARQQEEPNVCNVPGCPYSNKPPKKTICGYPDCPYLKPLPSCGIPNCPYEPVPLRFSCENPECPSKTVDFASKTIFKGKPEVPQTRRISEDQKQTAKTLKECMPETPCEVPTDCDNPDCEVPQQLAVGKAKKKRRRKKKGKFVYTMGDTYPMTKIGHKECVTPVFNVPPHMGWLWNIFTPMLNLKPRRGWRPGALNKIIAARIRAHRQAKGLGFLKVPTFKKDGLHYDEDEYKPVVPKPTLQIQKKEGTYWITMNPLKDPFSLVENEDPYMDCTPMTFKITKNKKQDDLCYCDCDCDCELQEQMGSTSSDSELDIEFTPPAGIIHPERFKKRPNVVCVEAQYDPTDFEDTTKKKSGKDKGGKKGKGGKGGKKGGKGGKEGKKAKGGKKKK